MKITIEYDKTSTDRPSMITVFKDGIELDPAVTSRYYTINGKWFSSPIDDYSWIVPSELIASSEAEFIKVLEKRCHEDYIGIRVIASGKQFANIPQEDLDGSV